jgi:hypothetical protein
MSERFAVTVAVSAAFFRAKRRTTAAEISISAS